MLVQPEDPKVEHAKKILSAARKVAMLASDLSNADARVKEMCNDFQVSAATLAKVQTLLRQDLLKQLDDATAEFNAL